MQQDIAELNQTEFTSFVKEKIHTILSNNLNNGSTTAMIIDCLINELYKNEIYIIPARLNYSVLGKAAEIGVTDTQNPNHTWTYLVTKSKVIPKIN